MADVRSRADKVRRPLAVYWSVVEGLASIGVLAGLTAAVLAWPMPPDTGINIGQLILGLAILSASVWLLYYTNEQRDS